MSAVSSMKIASKDKKVKKVEKTVKVESDSEPEVVLNEVKKEEKVKAVRKTRTTHNNTFKAVGIKRPSPYTVFMKHYFESLPKGAEKSITQAAKEYKKIKDDPKKMAPYMEEYEHLASEYKNEYNSQKQAAIDRGDFVVVERVKKPVSAYILFSMSDEVRNHAKKNGLSITETAKYCGALWKTMSEEEKEPFNSRALVNKEAAAVNATVANKKEINAKKAAATPVKKVTVVSESESSAASASESEANNSDASSDASSDVSSSSTKKKGRGKTQSSSKGKAAVAIVEENETSDA
jgi:hypothetical protein